MSKIVETKYIGCENDTTNKNNKNERNKNQK